MPDKIVCPRCRKAGWVRVERVIKGREHNRLYECGACSHTWSLPENADLAVRKPPRLRPRRGKIA